MTQLIKSLTALWTFSRFSSAVVTGFGGIILAMDTNLNTLVPTDSRPAEDSEFLFFCKGSFDSEA